MSPRRIAAGRAGAIKAVIALIAASACLGAVAYAATGTGSRAVGVAGRHVAEGAPQPAGSPSGRGQGERLPRVRLVETPAASSTAVDTQFRFHVPPRAKEAGEPSAPPAGSEAPTPSRRFQCSLDGGRWVACDSPYRLVGLSPGDHSFSVRALARSGRSGPEAAFGWQRVVERVSVAEQKPAEGRPFSIEQSAALDTLFPGDPAQQVPLSIRNPNPVPIEVTGLTATTGGAPGCGAENFELIPSNASPETPLVVPAEATVELPVGGASAPSIALRDLPLNQDACQGAEIDLDLSGEARG